MKATTPTTGITLDNSHPKKDGTLPIKLRVIHERKPRYFAVKFILPDYSEIDSLTPGDLERALSDKTRNERLRQIGERLNSERKRANEIIALLKDGFTFTEFKNQFTGIKTTADHGNIFYRYKTTIEDLKKENRFGTLNTFVTSLKHLQTFAGSDMLQYKDVDVKWLQNFEKFMTTENLTMLTSGKLHIKKALSKTTVGIDLRCLKTIFNAAIEVKEIEPNIYPFRRNASQKLKYKIPTGSAIKKALTKEDLRLLFNAPTTPDQQKARDFFFFSYTANGMNVKDICHLKNENLKDSNLYFYRAKTVRTSENPKLITVPLTGFAQQIIEKYRANDPSPKAYIFDVLKTTDTELLKHKKVKSFTKFINDNIKISAATVGVTTDISTYFARHTFATLAVQGGASLEFASEALGHSSLKTTKTYFAGFQDSAKLDILNKLMDF
jgi:site-specific recombinase XerD